MPELNLKIDENNLLNEWKGQAILMLDYGQQLADAQLEYDEAKARLSVVDAELDAAIRATPEKFGISKITETVVANTIILDPSHQEASRTLDLVRHDVKMLQAAVDAICQRKSALQGMTDLFLRQWYADPTSIDQPSELRTAAQPGGSTPAPNRKPRRREE